VLGPLRLLPRRGPKAHPLMLPLRMALWVGKATPRRIPLTNPTINLAATNFLERRWYLHLKCANLRQYCQKFLIFRG
jgi:hypothetical protein